MAWHRIVCAGLLLAVLSVAQAQIAASGKYRKDFVQAAQSVFGPFAPVSTLAAQIHVESTWDCSRVSKAGAKGCAQFIDTTARAMERNYPALSGGFDPFNPRQSFLAQSLLMLESVRRWEPGRTGCSAWIMGLADYNGGPVMLGREVAMCDRAAGCDSGLWYFNVELQNARAGWAWRENRGYPTRILSRQALYAAWGGGVCQP